MLNFVQNILLVFYCMLLLPLASVSTTDNETDERPIFTLTIWRNFTGAGEVNLFGVKLKAELVPTFDVDDDGEMLKYNLMLMLGDNLPLVVGEANLTFVEELFKTAKFDFTLDGFVDPIAINGTISEVAPANASESDYTRIYSTHAKMKLRDLAVNYHGKFSWPKDCGGWPQLHHSFTTDPLGVLNFRSSIDPACPDGHAMEILIDLDSNVWPLADFHLTQVFDFRPEFGNERMRAHHAFFKMLVEGTWNLSKFIKTCQVDLTPLARKLWPQVPNHWVVNFMKAVQGDVLDYLMTSVTLSQFEPAESDWQQTVSDGMTSFGRILANNVVIPLFQWLGVILGWCAKQLESFVKSGLIWPTLVALVLVVCLRPRISDSYQAWATEGDTGDKKGRRGRKSR